MIAAAVLAAALLLFLGSRDPFWNGDFINEAWPAYVALNHDGLGGLLAATPGYSGFIMLVGAPSALLADLIWGGVDPAARSIGAVFRLTALPGVVMLAALGAVLGIEARRRGARPLAWGLVVALAAGSPIAYQALLYGHPEDLLAAAASVLAVLAARDGRATLAGVLLAIAAATKQWAVLAVLPAMLAAPRGAWRIGLIAGVGAALALVPPMLANPASHAPLVTSGALFHPHQVWWPFGVPAPAEFTAAGHGSSRRPRGCPRSPSADRRAGAAASRFVVAAGRTRWQEPRRGAGPARAAVPRALRAGSVEPRLLPAASRAGVARLGGAERPPCAVLTLATTVATWLSFVTYDAHGYGPFLATSPGRSRSRSIRLGPVHPRSASVARPARRRQPSYPQPAMRRSEQRRAAVFALYQHDVTGRPLDDVFESTDGSFTKALAHATADNAPELDEHIARNAKGWTLDRIAPLEKAILRTALLEMLHPELVESDHPIPAEGAIDEAVETTKAFCGADAPGFVNGILGAVLREVRQNGGAHAA